MKIFNQQLLDLFEERHRAYYALFHFFMAVLCVGIVYFIYYLVHYQEYKFDWFTETIITGFYIISVWHFLQTIISIIKMIKQKRLEQKNIILQTIKQIDVELENKLLYRLSRLYQLYLKQIENNHYVNNSNSIDSLFNELDNQIYDTLMLLTNLKSMDKEKLQLLEMNNNPIYLQLYKEIILKEEIEQMEKCFNEFQYSVLYYAMHNAHSMIMAFKNNEINNLSEYERMENEIWTILNTIRQKASEK